MNKWWLVGLALPAIAGLIWIAITSGSNGKTAARPLSTQAPAEMAAPYPQVPSAITVPRKTVAAKPSTTAVAPASQAEPMPMQALHDLLDKDAEAALVAARKDLARDPDGPDAAEQTWVVVKALAATGHIDEARREADVMVPKFRDTRWANDVERHVLAHP
jgi:hypothetical protein